MNKLINVTLYTLMIVFFFSSCDTKISDLINAMQRSSIVCVVPGGSGNGSGVNWKNACATIDSAMNYVEDGGEIWVKKGTYDPAPTTINKKVSIIGGFNGDEELESEVSGTRSDIISVSAHALFRISADVVFKNFVVKCSETAFIFDESKSIQIINCKFNECSVTGNGAVINSNLKDVKISISNCSFSGNTASPNGGVIYSNSKLDLSISNCSFYGNSAVSSGGVIYSNARLDLRISNSTFENNHAADFGGLIYSESNIDVMVSNTLFRNNYADIAGGIIYSDGVADNIVIKNNCLFDSNGTNGAAAVTASGGVLRCNAPGSVISISDNCVFSNNSTDVSGGLGGVILGNKCKISIYDNCIFENNSTNQMGGVVYAVNSSQLYISDNCIFANNRTSIAAANANGGAIYIGNSTLNISNGCEFLSNSSNGLNGAGGAIFSSSSDVNIRQNYFLDNTAKATGNAILISGGTYNFDIISSNTFGPNDVVKLN